MKRVVYDIFPAVLAALDLGVLLSAGRLTILTALIMAGAFLTLRFVTSLGRLRGLLLPAALAVITECSMQLMITYQYLPVTGYQRIVDLILYFIIFLFLYQIDPVRRTGAIVGVMFFLAMGTVNFLVTYYRGRPVYFPDLYSAKTAANVVFLKGYSFPFSKVYLLAAGLLIISVIILFRKQPVMTKTEQWKRVIFSLLPVLALVCFFSLKMPEKLHFRSYYFSTTDYWLYSFTMSGYSMHVERPEGYDSDRIPITEESDRISQEKGTVQPNVIMIMNESFADLRQAGDFDGSSQVMPFIDSLKEEEKISEGRLYVSIFGGNTANTEFEVLTGISMYLLPVDTTAYNLYLNKRTFSLADYFESLGYRTLAFHPSKAENYNRRQAYPNLGFSQTYFQEDYQDWNVLRNYTISDQSNYEHLINLIESKDESEKLFVFNVTVQNHGPFDLEAPDLETRVDLGKQYPMASQYFSLLNYSDNAFEELIHYLESFEEPTVVIMFGDHQAKIEDSFYEGLFGKKIEDLTLDEEMKRYSVPYYVWSNYGLKITDCPDMSANYLGPSLTEWLQYPQTAEYKYLNELRQRWPVIVGKGLSRDGETFSETVEDEDILTYKQLGYNLLFDHDHCWRELFTLKEPQ